MLITLVQLLAMPDIEEFVTIEDAVNDDRIPYTAHWLRILCQKDKIRAKKFGSRLQGQWLIHMPSLLEYIEEQERLGTKKHSPK